MWRARSYAAAIFAALFLTSLILAMHPHSRNALAACVPFGIVGFPVCFYLWCKSDALGRGVTPPPGTIPLGAVLWPVAWLYYVAGTSAPARALRTIVLSAILAVAVFVSAAAIGHMWNPSAT